MKIIEKKFEKDYSYVTTLFSNKNVAFIDIETDGLSHKNKIVLIGMVIFSTQAEEGIVIQLFNDDYQSERDILTHLFTLLEAHKIQYFISFNGDSFDFPFMNARLKALKLNRMLNKKFNIDLLRVVRKNKAHFPFEKYTLKSLEKFVGIERSDTISGKDSVVLYHSYIESKNPKLEEIILLHNYDDIINMVPLLHIYQKIKFDALYMECDLAGKPYFLLSCELKNDICRILLGHPYKTPRIECYYESLGSTFDQKIEYTAISFEIKQLKANDSNTTLTVVNTHSVFNLDFSSLNQTSKEAYLIAVDNHLYWEHIVDVIKQIHHMYV
ncbi:ribonuclease H-like domain-containing protein [Fusibacter ferrireducens]|uniref:Ribonuclease H-like domain-containing protein n=1 Tax=Fusibacter ferrireducens TaxID=2785058 RepID=A0ABR9ZTR6_9FIRM|nr:ribonuclease H-like domain-containing protein [Fusibacter ferrireducens]MBF4693833.1 ribonuclease H-like domain-containing protein [Fusibacter ferrireducens]